MSADQVASEYDVRQLLDVRTVRGRRQFLVAWAGYPESDNTCVTLAADGSLARGGLAFLVTDGLFVPGGNQRAVLPRPNPAQ